MNTYAIVTNAQETVYVQGARADEDSNGRLKIYDDENNLLGSFAGYQSFYFVDDELNKTADAPSA